MIFETSATNSTPSEDKKLEVLNDHYKDSFSHLQELLRTRDKLFFLILITITLMLYQIFSPLEEDSYKPTVFLISKGIYTITTII